MIKKAKIKVPVATLWTRPGCARSIDKAALTPQADMYEWLSAMDREENIALCSEKRIQTQALFGEKVLITEKAGEWVHVLIPAQSCRKNDTGYPGWMPTSQLAPCTESEGRNEEHILVQSNFAILEELNETRLPVTRKLSFATLLPLLHEEKESVLVRTPSGQGRLMRQDVLFYERDRKKKGTSVVTFANQFLNLPYLWGGMSAYGFDCSGFSYSMLRACGHLLPRDAEDQAEAGQPVSPQEMEPGDLLYFAYDSGCGDIHHVGIYAGDGRMLHSPTPGKSVSLTALHGTIFEKELCTVRRYWE